MLRQNQFPALVLDAEGFSFALESGTRLHVNWAEIVSIKAYKLDLLTADEVRLAIALKDSPEEVIVSEEQPGYYEMVAEMEKRLNFPADWRAAVVIPPFATNETLLYVRA